MCRGFLSCLRNPTSSLAGKALTSVTQQCFCARRCRMKKRPSPAPSRGLLAPLALFLLLHRAAAGSPGLAERISLGAITFKPHSEAAAPAFLDQDFVRSLHPEDLLVPFWTKVKDPRCQAHPAHVLQGYR